MWPKIENVKMTCEQCGEVLFTTMIVHEPEDVKKLRQERDGLVHVGESLIDDNQRKQEQIEQDECLIESLRQERDDLRAALRQIGQGIDPHADQLQNWIAGIVDKALGEVVK